MVWPTQQPPPGKGHTMARSDFQGHELLFIDDLTRKMSQWVELPLNQTGPYAKHRQELRRIFRDVAASPMLFQRGEDRFVGIVSGYHGYRGKLTQRPTDAEFKRSGDSSLLDGLMVNEFDVWGLYREPNGESWFSAEAEYCIAVRLPKAS